MQELQNKETNRIEDDKEIEKNARKYLDEMRGKTAADEKDTETSS